MNTTIGGTDMYIGETDCFILSSMTEVDKDVKFNEDKFFNSFTECVDFVSEFFTKEIANKHTEDELKDICIPSREDIYNSLYGDSCICYVYYEGSEETTFVFHVTKISIGNTILPLKLDFCQK